MGRLALLEAMADVTSRMLDAAIQNDWDRLARLEREQAQLRGDLTALDTSGETTADLTAESAERAARLIEQMLADHDKIQQHAKPWLDSVKSLLSGAAIDRRVRNAYGSGDM